jgi:Family of unknown function (DUF5995)
MSGHPSIDVLVGQMRADLERLTVAGDARRFFHGVYLRTTIAVGEEIDRGGFLDGAWLTAWDLAFADLYLDALADDLAGAPVPQPWRVAFDVARDQPGTPPVRHVLLGINAHINYDLPQALLAVMSPEDFADATVLALREEDHNHLDTVLARRVAAEDAELTAVSQFRLIDRLLRPANRWATRRFLAEARAKVWRNAILLNEARLAGPERYAARLRELEGLCAARLADLSAPGPVLLHLARRGFGVQLAGTSVKA